MTAVRIFTNGDEDVRVLAPAAAFHPGHLLHDQVTGLSGLTTTQPDMVTDTWVSR